MKLEQFRGDFEISYTISKSNRPFRVSKLPWYFGKSCSIFISLLDPKACCYNCNGKEGIVPCIVVTYEVFIK